MKKLNLVFFLVLLISLATSLIFLVILPDVVPMHYNIHGEVDRFGSKYETLIYPGITLFIGFVMKLVAMKVKSDDKPQSERILLVAGILVILLFFGMSCYFNIIALNYNSSNTELPGILQNKGRVLSIALGSLTIGLGYLMPKVGRNAVFGVRTPWSKSSDEVWARTHKFAGPCFIIAGILMLVLGMVLPDSWNILSATALVLIAGVTCCVASYKYYKENLGKDSAPKVEAL